MENDAILQNLFSHYPELKPCEDAILAAFGILAECYDRARMPPTSSVN